MSEERITPKYLKVSTLVKTVSPTHNWGGGLEWRHLRDMNIVQHFPSLRAKKFLFTHWTIAEMSSWNCT